jgi:hypothetical protein
VADAWRAIAHVLSHHQCLPLSLPEEAADRLPDSCHHTIRQIPIGDTSDAKLTKNMSIYHRYQNKMIKGLPLISNGTFL